MKIVISGYIGKKITGIGRNLISLLNAITSDTQFIIYINKDMEDKFIFTNPNVVVKIYSISKDEAFKNLLWTTFIFPFKVLKEKADKALIPNFTLLLFKFKPTIIIMCDLIEFNIPNKFSKKKMFYRTKLADPITARRADKIITISENSKLDIKKFLNIPDEKIDIVHCGVDQRKFRKLNTQTIQSIFSQKKWPFDYILYAGTIDHPGKNSFSVIKAFEKLKSDGRYGGNLVLAGMPGEGFDIIERYVKQSEYHNDIVITGYINDKELIALYSACKVFCFLSLYEGFGLPPLEALACGAKVIVSNTSSLPEIIGNIGITVNPTNIDEIAENIYNCINSPISEKYDKSVKEHLEKYNWDVLAQKFNSVICN